MMMHIDKITFRLPSGFEGRAESIARLIGECLADMKIPARDGRIDSMTIGPLTMLHGSSDRDIAAMVGENLIGQVEKRL
jgi:hypothetical protein